MNDDERVQEILAPKTHPVGVAQRRLTLLERIHTEAEMLKAWDRDRGVIRGVWDGVHPDDSLDAIQASSRIWVVKVSA